MQRVCEPSTGEIYAHTVPGVGGGGDSGSWVPFTLISDVRPGTRSYASFAASVSEVGDARVFGGIHFRAACARGSELGRAVAQYLMERLMLPHGSGD